jgi:hypothetical protein
MQAEAMLHFVPLERPTTLDHRTKRVAGVSEVIKFLKGVLSIQVRGGGGVCGYRSGRGRDVCVCGGGV